MAHAASQSTRGIPAMGPGRWAAFDEIANGLPGPPNQTELLGTVLHRDFILPLAMACTLGCGSTVLGVFFPRTGLVALLAIAWAIGIDFTGGNSWVRRLTPRSIGRSVITWPAGGQSQGDPRPAILICLDAGRPVGLFSRLMLLYTLCALLVAIMGTLIHTLTPDIPLPTQRWGAVALAAGPLLATAISPLARRNCWVQSASKVAHELWAALSEQGPLKHRVAVAIIDQSSLHADGLNSLLICHRSRLRKDSTTVICWARNEGELQLVRPRRLRRNGAVGPQVQHLLTQSTIPEASGITSASVAIRAGHAAIGLTGGSCPREVSEQLCQMIQTLEAQEDA